jgi:hypothetical protein
MKHRPVVMKELPIPVETIRAMTNEERFSYYLLGHMFNELTFMKKLVGYSMNSHEDPNRARRDPEFAQTLTAFRMTISKIWEAKLAINDRKQIRATLQNKIFPKWLGGKDKLKALNKAINDAEWLSPVRNGLGFHYPNYDDWKNYISPTDDWVDDLVLFGEHAGNTFFHSSEVIAQHWFFSQFQSDALEDAIDPMVEQMINLMILMTEFLEGAISVLISEELAGQNVRVKEVGKVLAPNYSSITIPFWTS